MFNEELKKEFLRGYTSSVESLKNYVSVFNRFEEYERELGVDVYSMTRENLELVLESMSGVAGKTKWAKINMIADYVDWCRSRGIDGVKDEILHVKINGFDTIRNKMVANPTQLQDCLDSIFEPESNETVEDTARCFLWLAFAGMKNDDIVKVKVSDVNLAERTVTYNEKKYNIYNEAYQSFVNCVTLSQFNQAHPLHKKRTPQDRKEGEILLRGIRSANPTAYGIANVLSRKKRLRTEKGITVKDIEYKTIWKSGMFFVKYEHERAGRPISFADMASTYFDPSQKEKEFAEDYEAWKFAFRI